MAYRNVRHYRHTVHLYLDSIWSVSSKPKKARTTMYKWLALQMGIDYHKCHVKWFTRDQCRQAIRILKAKHIQLYGKDLFWERAKERMEKQEAEELANSLSGSYWNYRWLKSVEDYDGEQEISYALHEVYYDKEEKPFMWTEEPVKIYCEDAEELMELIGKTLDACTQKVLLKYYDGEQPKIKEIDEYIQKSEVLGKWRKNKEEQE